MTTIATPRGTCQLPFLPGYAAQEVKFGTSRKPQTLSFGPGGCIDSFHKLKKVPRLNLALTERLRDPFHRYDMSQRSPTHEERDFMKQSARNTYRPANEPAWLKHDRHVLKFDAYTQDRMFESTKETFRIRCCVLYFYLEDGTIMVSEPKVENSGMAQGTVVKRHRIPKPKCLGGGPYSYEDFRVGSTVSIYSQIYKLIACDEFTRKFYWDAMGAVQPDDQDPPIDSFLANLQVDEEAIAERSATLSESKEYHHLACGGNRKNQKLEQYLENDRKVLRFHCFWDDMTKYGTRMYYTLHYYLADDTAEILENMSRNSGRDPYPTFWRRSPLRKNPNITATPGMMEPEPVVYKPEDLVVGEFVNILGRNIFLYDCDVFTRDFYKEYMGFEQTSIKIEQPKLVHTKIRYPPHIGFGSEEDSLASCLRLTPRPPLRDMKRLIADADKVMRFEAKLANDIPQDEKRRFIVAVFMADDSVGVWELKSRNSGHDEGKFANKARRKNPTTGTWFCQADFFVGAVIEVNSSPFQLIWADDAAFLQMETNPTQFPYADESILVKKMGPVRGTLENLTDMIEWRSLQSLAKEAGVELVDHEAITLARAFGRYQGPPARKADIDVSKLLLAMDFDMTQRVEQKP